MSALEPSARPRPRISSPALELRVRFARTPKGDLWTPGPTSFDARPWSTQRAARVASERPAPAQRARRGAIPRSGAQRSHCDAPADARRCPRCRARRCRVPRRNPDSSDPLERDRQATARRRSTLRGRQRQGPARHHGRFEVTKSAQVPRGDAARRGVAPAGRGGNASTIPRSRCTPSPSPPISSGSTRRPSGVSRSRRSSRAPARPGTNVGTRDTTSRSSRRRPRFLATASRLQRSAASWSSNARPAFGTCAARLLVGRGEATLRP